MQAIELMADIDEKQQIHLQLPATVTAQSAKVIVMYEEAPQPDQSANRVFGQFRGKVHMADDFDAELSEDFWLGQGREA
jgi:hypothetical protein